MRVTPFLNYFPQSQMLIMIVLPFYYAKILELFFSNPTTQLFPLRTDFILLALISNIIMKLYSDFCFQDKEVGVTQPNKNSLKSPSGPILFPVFKCAFNQPSFQILLFPLVVFLLSPSSRNSRVFHLLKIRQSYRLCLSFF